MKKRTISLLLVLMMILSLFGGVSAFAADAETPTTETETIAEPQEAPSSDPETGSDEASETPSEEETTDEETTEETTEEASSEEETGEAADEETTEETSSEEETTSEEATSEEDELVVLDAAAPAKPDGEGGGSVTYTKIDSLADAKKYVAFVSGSKAWYMDMNVLGGKDVTVSGDSCEVSKGVSAQVAPGSDGGYTITLDDPPSTPNYLYVSGTSVATSKTNEGYDKWNYADGKLVYDGTYYLKADFTSVTTDASEAAEITLYTGDESSMGGGGGGGSETTDALAPTITKQPVGGATNNKTDNYCGLEIEAELKITDDDGNTATVDSDKLSYQWYRDNVAIDGDNARKAILDATFSSEYGVHTYYCKVTYTDADGVEHSTDSEPAALIYYAGVNANDAILFSDVHQEPENIGSLLAAYMSNNGGNLPGLVFATGDYHNGSGVVEDTDKINASLDAIKAMLGGEQDPMKVFYLGGNHESSSIMQTKNGGTGLIYGDDTTPVYVYTINYDEIPSSGYQSIITNLKDALENIATKGDKTKPVLIIAHAGLHTLDSSEASGSYNIDYSDQMVDLLNEYGSELDLYYFFGHNHSKGEAADYKVAGNTVVATYKYADGARYNRTLTLNFTYAHMGYLNGEIGGGETATVMKIATDGSVTLQRVAQGEYGASITTAKGTKDVPVVSALEESYPLGTTLKAEVAGESSGGQGGGDKPSSKPDSKPDGEGGGSGSTPPSEPEDKNEDALALDAAPPAPPEGGGQGGGSKPEGGGGSSKFDYQWYTATGTNLVSATATAIDGATKSSYKPDVEGYYFCEVTGEDGSTATTTVAYVGEIEDDDEPTDTTVPKAGDYVIVMQSGDAYYALLSDASGALSVAEVTVENGEVLGPVTDDYIWHFDNPESGSVKSMNSGKYLMRTSAQSGGTASLATADSGSTWVYDAALHLLYNKTAGGSTSYFYPTIKDGQLDLGKVSTLAESGIYLMKVHVEESTAKPNTEVKVPPTGDDSGLAIWAASVLTASATLTGLVLGKKKEN